jgi:hypothetical protein
VGADAAAVRPLATNRLRFLVVPMVWPSGLWCRRASDVVQGVGWGPSRQH